LFIKAPGHEKDAEEKVRNRLHRTYGVVKLEVNSEI
jgi:hypothetical protein